MFRLFICILFSFCIITSSYANDALQLVYYENAQPLSWCSNGQMKGILIDILDEAFVNRMKLSVKHTGYPWARAQHLVEIGKADAFVTVPTAKRQEYTDISTEPVFLLNVHLYTWKGNPKIDALRSVSTYKELRNFKLVDYLGNGKAKRDLKGIDVHWVPKADLILPILAAGRVDAWTANSAMANYNIKQLGYQDKIIKLPNILSTVPFHLCIGKKSGKAELLKGFDATIRSMQKDGILQRILKRYE